MPLLSRMNRGVGITLLVSCLLLVLILPVSSCQGVPINGPMELDSDADSGDWSIVFTLVLIILILILILVIIIFIALYEVIIHNLKKRLGLSTTNDIHKSGKKKRTKRMAEENEYFDDSDFEQDSPAPSYSQGSGDFSFAPPGSPWAPSGEKMREWNIDEVIPDKSERGYGGSQVDSQRGDNDYHETENLEKDPWSSGIEEEHPDKKVQEVSTRQGTYGLNNDYRIEEAEKPDIQLPEFRGIKLDGDLLDNIPSDELFNDTSHVWKMKSRIPDNLQIDETPGMIIQDDTPNEDSASEQYQGEVPAQVAVVDEVSEKGFLDNGYYKDDDGPDDTRKVSGSTIIDEIGMLSGDGVSEEGGVNAMVDGIGEDSVNGMDGGIGEDGVYVMDDRSGREDITGRDGVVSVIDIQSEPGMSGFNSDDVMRRRDRQSETEVSGYDSNDIMRRRDIQSETEVSGYDSDDVIRGRDMQNEPEAYRVNENGVMSGNNIEKEGEEETRSGVMDIRSEWSEKGDETIRRVGGPQHILPSDPVLDIDSIRPIPGDPHQFIVDSGLFKEVRTENTEKEGKSTNSTDEYDDDSH